MAKVTKKPKKVHIEYEEVKRVHYIAKYECPSCLVGYRGYGPSKTVKRFVCKCGQELIVD